MTFAAPQRPALVDAHRREFDGHYPFRAGTTSTSRTRSRRRGPAGLADVSPEMTTLVRRILQLRYGAWRRFDELLTLNIAGMIAWRAGKSPAAH